MSSNLCQQSQAHRLYSLYLHYDASHAAKHEDPECKAVLQHCFALFEKDYVVGTVPNHNGQLCPSYPSELAILEKPRQPTQKVDGPGKADMQESDKGQSCSTQGDVASIPTDPLHSTPSAALLTSPSSRILPLNSSISPRFATHNGATADSNEGNNNHNSQHEPIHSENMDNSMIEDGDQSFDLGESGMMSFQDIKTELDFIHHPSPLKNPTKDSDRFSRRHVLPFPFRIPRTEESKNYSIKEYVGPSSTVATAVTSNNSNSNDNNNDSGSNDSSKADKDKVNDTQELSKQFEKSHFARVRARFVIPCILVRGKNICRSATLSNEVEVFMHSVNQKFNELNQKRKMFLYGTGEKSPDKEDRESSLEKQRLEDIELLHRLGVTYINDLMVENRKVKYGLKVTSSEKVDSFGRYSKFKLVATPYPGVEFFQKFKANKYSARKLCFDWSQNFADAELQLPPGHIDNLGIRWRDYKGWDLIELTQNYLRLYLSHIADDTPDPRLPLGAQDHARSQRGLLIHCISGWDRTPLFISLLRISLWADGEAHQSLSAAEILYLTMGYDWFLFNHLLADRSQRGEDIFYFCFYFLKFIYGDEFSLKSVSDLKDSRNGRAQSSKSKRASTVSPSPLSRDLGRVRDSEFGGVSPPLDGENQGSICDECRTARRTTMEPAGRDMVSRRGSAQDVASSTDGKPSSWQLVSFSTPPRGDRHGSPRAPFVPTLPSIGKASGPSLFGHQRASPAIGFVDNKRLNDTDTTSGKLFNSSATASTSPFLASEGRPHLKTNSFNARRSSSSSIPELFSEESKRQAAAAAAAAAGGGVSAHPSAFQNPVSNTELSRLATSPNLFAASRPQEALEGETSAGSHGDNSLLERQRIPRKRASTFDGGLLLSNEPGARAASDKEDCDDVEEDLTSGDEDVIEDSLRKSPMVAQAAVPTREESKLFPAAAETAQSRSRICQVCHHSFLPKPATENSEAEDRSNNLDMLGQSPHSVLHGHSKHLRPLLTKLGPIESMRDEGLVYGCLDMDYLCHPGYQQSQPDECDREEGMFQLEIEDAGKGSLGLADDCRGDNQPPNTRHSAYLGRGSSTVSPKCSASRGGSIASSSPATERDLNLAADRSSTPAHQDDACIDGDENESFWDETSTVDYGYSPGSILNGFGLGLTKYPAEAEDDLGLGLEDSLRPDGTGEDHDDQEDDDDDDDDDADDDDEDDEGDGVDGLRTRGGVKASRHEHDHLFMPSLQGVFSKTGHHADRGRKPSAVGIKSPKQDQNTSVLLGPSPGSKLEGKSSRAAEGASPASLDSLPPRPPSPPKALTRRQKLRQLRRLFMDIRGEIGDGSRPPSVVLETKSSTRGVVTAGGLSSGSVGPLDDGGRSLKAESFSDDPSFQYRSPIATAAAFANRLHHGSGPSNGYQETESSNQPFFARSRVGSGSGIVSPIAKHSTKQQSQPSLQGNSLMTQPSSGRKSPFEWAAAAASSAAASITSSASGIVTGGFGNHGNHANGNCGNSNHGNNSNGTTVTSASNFGESRFEHRSGPTGSNHFSRQFTMPSPHIPSPRGQQQHHHHLHNYQSYQSHHSGGSNHFQTSTTGNTTPPVDPYASESTTSMISPGTKQSANLVFSGRFDTGQGTTRRQSMTAAGAAAMNISRSRTTGSPEAHRDGSPGSPVLSMSSPSRLRGSAHGFGGSHPSGTLNSTTGIALPVSSAAGGGAAPASVHIKEKGGEHNGRWDWMPGIFA